MKVISKITRKNKELRFIRTCRYQTIVEHASQETDLLWSHIQLLEITVYYEIIQKSN